jgi:predicted glycoside hydrolase/deacetylase ChbG (UPF0249 family)
MGAVGRIAREFGITRVRNPVEHLRDSWRTARTENAPLIGNMAASASVRAVGAWFNSLSRKYGLRSPDNFLGLAVTGRMSAAALCRLIDTLPEGRTEIMSHPGIYDAELVKSGSRLQQQRQTELEGLLATESRRAVESNGVRLISYRELN